MKTAQNQTALLRRQEQELRDAVGYAVEIAQKAGAGAEVSVTKSQRIIGVRPFAGSGKCGIQ